MTPEAKLPLGQVLRRASVKFNTQGTLSQSLYGSRGGKSVGKAAANQDSLGNFEAAIS